MIEPLDLTIPDATLDDLRRRLDAVVMPEATPGEEWSRGIPPRVVRDLVDRWRNDFDWRKRERRLARDEHIVTDLDGCRVHAAIRRSTRPGRLPVLVTHGWPYTFAEMLPLADALDGELDVVLPSLPGSGFSEALPEPFTAAGVARRWDALMTDVLGYDRYLVYGEDVGAPVSDWLAGAHDDHVAGIVASHPSYSGRSRDGVELTVEETEYFATQFPETETGYAHIQGTRPDTLAIGLLDSPAGLLAWIAEKVAAWSDGGTATGLDGFAPDDVLALATLTWATRSIGTSFRPYAEGGDEDGHPVVRVPASVLVHTHEARYPRVLAERTYLDIRAFRRLARGGHFTAWEASREVADAVLALELQVR